MSFNFCRNPNCRNFAVPHDPDRIPRSAELGSYRLEAGGRHGSQLHCLLCDRKTSIISNAAAALEIQRLRSANGLLRRVVSRGFLREPGVLDAHASAAQTPVNLILELTP